VQTFGRLRRSATCGVEAGDHEAIMSVQRHGWAVCSVAAGAARRDGPRRWRREAPGAGYSSFRYSVRRSMPRIRAARDTLPLQASSTRRM